MIRAVINFSPGTDDRLHCLIALLLPTTANHVNRHATYSNARQARAGRKITNSSAQSILPHDLLKSGIFYTYLVIFSVCIRRCDEFLMISPATDFQTHGIRGCSSEAGSLDCTFFGLRWMRITKIVWGRGRLHGDGDFSQPELGNTYFFFLFIYCRIILPTCHPVPLFVFIRLHDSYYRRPFYLSFLFTSLTSESSG